MSERTILVDGYNAIRRSAGLRVAEQGGLEAGREALLRWLANRYRGTPHRVIVVFDGSGAEEHEESHGRWRCRVVFSRAGEAADAVVQRRARELRAAGAEVVVFSDDLEVREGAREAGAEAESVESLRRVVDAPDRYRQKQARHRAFVRRQFAGDDEEKPRGGR